MSSHGGMPYRSLGRTGEQVSLIGLGGSHLGTLSEQEAIRIIRTALDEGVNFLDNCWDYHGGASETRMGKALKDGYRNKAFLMTKFDARNARGAMQQIDESLRRLQVETIDLLQIHEVIRAEDPGWVFAQGGAIEALLEAQRSGKARYIGFTGHKDPGIHLQMLETARAHGVTFDAVQLPLNVMDPHYRSFEREVVPVLVQHGIGVLGMKPMGAPYIVKSGIVTPRECLHYVMHLPVSVVITGVDSMPILHQALEAARSFRPLSREEVAELLARTADAGSQGQLELYKTGRSFDGTFHHPQWLTQGAELALPQA